MGCGDGWARHLAGDLWVLFVFIAIKQVCPQQSWGTNNEYSENLRVRTYILVSAANKVVIFWGNFWQFRLSRLLISLKKTRLFTTRKIKKLDWRLSLC